MSSLNPEQLIDGLLDHMLYLHVVHHVEGRIRVKASWNGARKLSRAHEETMERIIAVIPGVREYRINKKALSVVIQYDPERLPFALWEEVAALGQDPTRRESVRRRLLEILDRKTGTSTSPVPDTAPLAAHQLKSP